MSGDGPILPGVLGQIARVAGDDAALAIARARGGTEIYVPPQPDKDHWLSRLVGHRAAIDIAEALTWGVGPIRVVLPIGPAGNAAQARAKVDAMLRDNRSERDIALATGYTIRGVRMRRAKLGTAPDRRQGDLFG